VKALSSSPRFPWALTQRGGCFSSFLFRILVVISITNCKGSSLTGSSSSSSLFQRTSSSNWVVSPSISNTTGSTRWSTRTQFSTCLVVVFPDADGLMNVAKDATEADEGVGNVWSEMRLKSREQTTRIKVATFSGASCNALRIETISY